MRKSALTRNEKNLIRRYLVWCYKTTKEELDRIDRKFTQLAVDDFILGQLNAAKKKAGKEGLSRYNELVNDFEKYIADKAKGSQALKFTGPGERTLEPKYFFLKERLAAIEKSIVSFLSRKDLAVIESLYEAEMTQRILGSKEHT